MTTMFSKNELQMLTSAMNAAMASFAESKGEIQDCFDEQVEYNEGWKKMSMLYAKLVDLKSYCAGDLDMCFKGSVVLDRDTIKTKQDVWVSLLGQYCHCYPDDEGCMPCDNGMPCDRCMYNDALQKAYEAELNKLGIDA